MKRNTRSPEYKHYMRRHSRRQLKAQLRFKAIRRRRRRGLIGVSTKRIKGQNEFYTRHNRLAITVVAPAVFSFVRDPEGVSAFINRLKQCLDRNIPVWVGMRRVKEIGYDGITVLLSVMCRFRARGLDFNGDHPDNRAAKRVLEQSGFFDHLKDPSLSSTENFEIAGQGSIMSSRSTVDPPMGERTVQAASKTVWGQVRRAQGCYRVLIELMHNTHNHAYRAGAEDKHWWVSVQNIEGGNRACFSFVDYGVGVFYSLQHKEKAHPLYNVVMQLFEELMHGTNAEILRAIFAGQLHRTSTGQSHRGKGLASIHRELERNGISNLVMISNDVYYNSDGEEYRILENPFDGTFVYWELRKSNRSLQ